jgi:homoserine O-acetyltransferase
MIYEEMVSTETRKIELNSRFELESGVGLSGVQIAYRAWGQPRERAILICHALTGNADADDWWSGLFGPGRAFDPERSYIIASNVLGGCYGTTGPTSTMPGQDVHYAADFPRVTIRDMVNLQAELIDALGVESLELVVGGSMGGMQVLEWAALYPDRVHAMAPVCTSSQHSGWTIGISEAQRSAIRADEGYRGGYYRLGDGPRGGLAAARMMALASYRSFPSFERRFGREVSDAGVFEIESYQQYQGQKLVDRFDANSYIRLTQAMDSHDLGRGRDASSLEVLRGLETPATVFGVTSDLLYPLREQEALVEHLPDAELVVVDSEDGHDAFLIEFDPINDGLVRLLERTGARGGQELERCG